MGRPFTGIDECKLRVFVNVFNHEAKEKIKGARIVVTKNGIEKKVYYTNSKGNTKTIILELENEYRITINKENYLKKMIEINTKIPEEDRYSQGWEIPLDVKIVNKETIKTARINLIESKTRCTSGLGIILQQVNWIMI